MTKDSINPEKPKQVRRMASCETCNKGIYTTKTDGPSKCFDCRRSEPKAAPKPRASRIVARTIVCPMCGVEFVAKHKLKAYCTKKCSREATRRYNACIGCGGKVSDHKSERCRDCFRFDVLGWSRSTDLVLIPKPEREWGTPAPYTLEQRKGWPLVAGPCRWCGDEFIGPPLSAYCQKRCAVNAYWKRKDDTRGRFAPTPQLRQFICDRDKWTCQICHGPVDPSATHNTPEYATLDHIIPQSLQLIPDHSASNLRLAHMCCNARRGNRTEDLALTA